jgi:hypothetical protein
MSGASLAATKAGGVYILPLVPAVANGSRFLPPYRFARPVSELG